MDIYRLNIEYQDITITRKNNSQRKAQICFHFELNVALDQCVKSLQKVGKNSGEKTCQ